MINILIIGLIDYIFNPIYYGWGLYLAERLNIYFVIFFAVLLFFLIIIFFNKQNIKKKIFITTLFLFLYYFLIFIPYCRGNEILELKSFGIKLIEKIENYEVLYGKIPQTLRELYPQFLNEEDLIIIKDYFIYWYYNKDYYNEKDKIYKNVIPLEKDSYSINIEIDFLLPYYLKTNQENNNFIITDD